MALYIGDELIAGNIDGQQLNNPFSLLDYKYSEYELSNASWLLSNGQFNSGVTYSAVYNLLLQIYNGTVTKNGVSVKLSTEAYTDTDFVLNTDDTTFRLPTVVKLASGKAVAGNGNALGLTNGSVAYPLSNNSGGAWALGLSNTSDYSLTTAVQAFATPDGRFGVDTDETKSGIETSANGLYLYFYVGDTVQDANIIAAAGVLTDVADLKAHSIVETYINGTSWYRVYSDGWCEQGGYINPSSTNNVLITLLKSYIDINYSCVATSADNRTPLHFGSLTEKTVSQVPIRMNATSQAAYWRTAGYIS